MHLDIYTPLVVFGDVLDGGAQSGEGQALPAGHRHHGLPRDQGDDAAPET